MASDSRAEESLPFVYSELNNALREQQVFGITHSVITHFTPFEATARVVLLEGTTIVVSLTSRGYKLSGVPSRDDAALAESVEGETTFESIEALLQLVSPMYITARQDALLSKLNLMG